jgi:hypothetical protein
MRGTGGGFSWRQRRFGEHAVAPDYIRGLNGAHSRSVRIQSGPGFRRARCSALRPPAGSCLWPVGIWKGWVPRTRKIVYSRADAYGVDWATLIVGGDGGGQWHEDMEAPVQCSHSTGTLGAQTS